MTKCKLSKSIAIAAVAILLLAEFSLFHDFFYPLQSLWQQGKRVECLLSLLFFLWSLLGAFLLFFSPRTLLRKITLPFFLFFFLFNIGSFKVANAPLDFQQAAMIVENFLWWFWETVENLWLALLPLLLIFIPIAIFVERLPDLLAFNIPKKAYFIPLSALVLATIGLQSSHGFFDRYPSFFRIPSMLAIAGFSRVYDGERLAVAYSGSFDAGVEKIVLVVDESIRADILGVNGATTATTPYLNSLAAGIVNFGLAASASNCSDYSNLILRTGVRKEAIPDAGQMTLKVPSIWQFTQKAGFHNVYLDAQSAEEWGNYQNFMNDHEAAFVDEILRFRQQTAYESDSLARDKLVEYLRKPGKTFIMLNKYGIHFPYFRSYPAAFNVFTPSLKPGEPMQDREKSLNSYMNGIRWSVDDWFAKLLAETADFQSYVILYTSDHGQNIVDDGSLATHCRPMANRFEGLVPMMVFSNDRETLQQFKAAQSMSYNNSSHFQVFPTLLRLAGYEAAWVRGHYGASLREAPDSGPEFFVGDIHGRGSVRRWVSIYAEQRSAQPRSADNRAANDQ